MITIKRGDFYITDAGAIDPINQGAPDKRFLDFDNITNNRYNQAPSIRFAQGQTYFGPLFTANQRYGIAQAGIGDLNRFGSSFSNFENYVVRLKLPLARRSSTGNHPNHANKAVIISQGRTDPL